MPQPTFDDLRRFCEIDGWSKKVTTRGGSGDHDRYRKQLADGTILRTKASHGKQQIGNPSLWHHIWKDQLGLETEDQFWSALKTGKAVRRGAEVPRGTPDWLIRQLVRTVGMTEAEALALTPEEAAARWERYLTNPREGAP